MLKVHCGLGNYFYFVIEYNFPITWIFVLTKCKLVILGKLISLRFIFFIHKIVGRLNKMVYLKFLLQCVTHSGHSKHRTLSFSKDLLPLLL